MFLTTYTRRKITLLVIKILHESIIKLTQSFELNNCHTIVAVLRKDN